jgi:hypothetical protein
MLEEKQQQQFGKKKTPDRVVRCGCWLLFKFD